MGGEYGASKDHGETDDPLVDSVVYSGITYYIDCDGSDLADGLSPSTAWKTLDKVNSKTNVGYWDTVSPNFWTSATSGSAFLFKRGCTFEGAIKYHPYITGGFSENYTFGAYGNRGLPRPIIHAVTAPSMNCVMWDNGHPGTFRNLHFKNSSNSVNNVSGLCFNTASNITIANIEVEGAYGDGVNADSCDNFSIENSVIYNNMIGTSRGGGIVGGHNTNFRISSSTFLNNGIDQIGSHNIYARHLNGAVFENNLIVGGSNHGIVIHGTSTDVTIRHNDIYDNSNGIGVNGGYSSFETFTDFTIEKNRIHDNGYKANEQGYAFLIASLTNSHIRNNLVYNNRLGAFNLYSNLDDAPSSNVKVLNNLFSNPFGTTGVVFNGASTTNVSFMNNIVEQESISSYAVYKYTALPDSELHLDYNLYLTPSDNIVLYNTTPYSLASLRASALQELHGIKTDPLFTNASLRDYRLLSGSPAINVGTTTSDVADDILGTLRFQGSSYDIGAYEYTGIDITPPLLTSIASTETTATANITWTTDEGATSKVEYSTDTSYSASSALNSSLSLTHTVTLTGLTPGTLYHYRVISRDVNSNTSTSGDHTFTTTAISRQSSSSGGGGGGSSSTL